MALYFCPSSFETPYTERRKFETFGMGPEAARKLGRKLSLTKPQGPIFVAGSAGAIRPGIKVGECFIIKKIGSTLLPFHRELQFLPQASLVSVEQPLSSKETKDEKFRQTGADLVDCEMEFLYEELTDELQNNVIFVRGVIDDSKTNIGFLNGYKIDPKKLLNPFVEFQFMKFIYSFFVYRKKMDHFFNQVVRSLNQEEITRKT